MRLISPCLKNTLPALARKTGTYVLVILFAAGIIAVASSFNYTLPDYAPEKLKPCSNFDWLQEFYILNRALEPKHWEQNPSFGFDSAGVVTVNKKYNAVSISQYALVCFDNFRESGDEKFKEKFLNQALYLKSPEAYININDNCIGFPYQYNFHDLKAPWYSGLAQGEVISVLIRYYYLTKDEEVLPVIIKSRNLMLLPIQQKGLFNKTAEGNVWIEEYPNSKQHLHVLNGFLVTTASMYEYCKFFPQDKEAYDIYKKCLVSIKESAVYYEMNNNWLTYDRGAKGAVSNWYMKAQVLEMEQLFMLTGDPYFKKQSILWGTYCYQRNLDYVGCNINTINYAVPAIEKNDFYFAGSNTIKLIDRANILTDTAVGFSKPYRKFSLIDDNVKTVFSSAVNPSERNPFLQLTFKLPIVCEGLQWQYVKDSASLLPDYLEIKEDAKSDWKKIKLNATDKAPSNFNELAFKKIYTVKEARLFFQHDRHVNKINLASVNFYTKPKNDSYLKYAFKTSEVIKTDSNCNLLNMSIDNTNEYYIFSRSSKDSLLNKVAWTANNSYTDVGQNIYLGDGHCYTQFLYVFRTLNEQSSISQWKLEPCTNRQY